MEENGGSMSPDGGVQPDTTTKQRSIATETERREDDSYCPKIDLSEEPNTSREGNDFTELEHEKRDSATGSRHGRETSENLEEENVCRICHMSSDNASEKMELIRLGCGCKGELGASHLQCAETWFKQRGNRNCEICGQIAKNVTAIQDARILIDLDEMRFSSRSSSTNLPRRARSCHCRLSCNFLWALLLLAFTLSWFFRVDML